MAFALFVHLYHFAIIFRTFHNMKMVLDLLDLNRFESFPIQVDNNMELLALVR